jgi:CHAD domain-containing protein
MSYFIAPNETIPTGIMRVAGEQTGKAIGAMEYWQDDERVIHKVRKHLKKLRALMRLMRDEIGEEEYKRHNVFYRDLGRELSDVRDVTSLLEILERLKEKFGDSVKAQTFEPLEELLGEERTRLKAQQLEKGDRMEHVKEELEQSAERFEQIPISSDCWEEMVSSVRRVYKRGYKGFQASLEQPTTETMHEWRKRVKYLWYHNRLLRHAWYRIFQSFRRETKQLSDILGDYHDYALLKAQLIQVHDQLPAQTIQATDAFATKQQEVLLERAYLLGQRVYAESPKAFAHRLEHYLDAWRREREMVKPEKQVEVV